MSSDLPPVSSVIAAIVPPRREDAQKLARYIHDKWDELTRTHEQFYLGMLDDDKVPVREGAKPILYISQQEDYGRVRQELDRLRQQLLQRIAAGDMPQRCADAPLTDNLAGTGAGESDRKVEILPEIDLRVLPDDHRTIPDDEHGLLYLPHPYVVPGGRFNETYGWDSAFIVRGLVLENHYDTAKYETDNKLYSIQHYGMILNANRSYYLGRSQAPFLTQKVLDVFQHYDKLSQPQPQDAITWLKSALDGINRYYSLWVSPPYLHKDTGLSYYNDLDETPGIEVLWSEKDHYPHALQTLRRMYQEQQERDATLPADAPRTYQQRKDAYYLSLYYLPRHPDKGVEGDGRPLEETDGLTARFYRGDRAMRASGFDPSRRFGFFNVDVIHHLPVCLNTLLYVMEQDTAQICDILAQVEPDGKNRFDQRWDTLAEEWRERARLRHERIDQWLWDSGHDQTETSARYPGYRDYNFQQELCRVHDIPQHRNYVFATAFYPLWAGIASSTQAEQVVKHIYPQLITPHGLMTSNRETGSQWDAPFAWAPLQIIAVRGLLRYGYTQEALAIASGFLNTVLRGFAETGKIFEKYDMQRGSHRVSDKIDKGYSINVEGFGWTNAVASELMALLENQGCLR